MRGIGLVARGAWRVGWPYFRSEERGAAWALAIAVVVLNLAMTGLDVVLNLWRGGFYDAIAQKDWRGFLSLLFAWRSGAHGFLPGWAMIILPYVGLAVLSRYLSQLLQIRWRRWLTSRMVNDWLSDHAYYRISLENAAAGDGSDTGGSDRSDNPDQRLADDIGSFCADTITLSVGLLSSVVALVSFVAILWGLSGAMRVFGVAVPGSMVWLGLGYAIIGTALTHLVGYPLVWLDFMRERVEANFRFALVRVRQNAAEVALQGGEAPERDALDRRFMDIVRNWRALMRRRAALNSLVIGYGQASAIVPLLVAAPRYFFGTLSFGGLMRIAGAFGQMQASLSWFVTSYAALAAWGATVTRLAGFADRIATARNAASGIARQHSGNGPGWRMRDVTLALPDTSILLADVTLDIPAGGTMRLRGAPGIGKSTLLRALAGIWPFGSGRIEMPPGAAMFLSPNSYLASGSLRTVLSYPGRSEAFADDRMRDALETVGLGYLSGRLDEDRDWSATLSTGERQLVGLARALLHQPAWLFLDEALSGLDGDTQASLGVMLHDRLPHCTVTFVGHKSGIGGPHDRTVELGAG